jgi:hypothetical protein
LAAGKARDQKEEEELRALGQAEATRRDEKHKKLFMSC